MGTHHAGFPDKAKPGTDKIERKLYSVGLKKCNLSLLKHEFTVSYVCFIAGHFWQSCIGFVWVLKVKVPFKGIVQRILRGVNTKLKKSVLVN
jgi:hypothetical protein